MNPRTPASPPPVMGQERQGSGFAPAIHVRPDESTEASSAVLPSTEPRRSFARGVAVGIAIMIPIWVWLIIRFL